MKHRNHLALIGSGPSAIYLLKHLLDEVDLLKHHLAEISIFEKSHITGIGMPYSPRTTDRYNIANISSEELPELPDSFADWLRAQDAGVLEDVGLANVEIQKDAIYSRLALGKYLNAQYRTLLARLADHGILVHEHPGCEIIDVADAPAAKKVTVTTADGAAAAFDQVIIATGHLWSESDKPAQGLYASPWPISKLLPKDGDKHNFAIGTLGASLSAFDVIASLAHRHGDFVESENGRLSFQPHPGTDDFKLYMHASQGLLPHLQFGVEDLSRLIYRHVDRATLLGLVDDSGYLRLDTYFDQVCRPALVTAFIKDELPLTAASVADPSFSLRDFVEKMVDKHDYEDAFLGMRYEMWGSEESVLGHKPIHWKETIDDLIYTLNFHVELMPAEDHFKLKSLVMPFLMNVIAAMPIESGHKLLALYDAGKIAMISGKVSIADEPAEDGSTTITVTEDEQETVLSYRMFIDCSGQKPLELEDYPFPRLVKDGTARRARAHFENAASAEALTSDQQANLFQAEGETVYHIGGIDIDGTYRLIGRDGSPNPRIHDIAFPHTSGVRPYSYGLQSCSDTGAILVKTWVEEIRSGEAVQADPADVTRIYERV